MNFFKKTLWIVSILTIGLINIKQMTSKTVSQQPEEYQSVFGEPTTISSEDFWKIFASGMHEYLNEPEKKTLQKNALVIINEMNSISDAFNKDYSFAEANPLLIMSQLKLFLANPKNQISLKKFIQITKENIANFPERFSNIGIKLEQSINEKNAEQFYAIYSTLEHYFRGLPIKSLVKINQAGWLTTIKNAIMNRARRAYNYLFGSKSAEDQGFGVVSKYIITSDDSTGKPVTKMITETKDASGKITRYEEVIEK